MLPLIRCYLHGRGFVKIGILTCARSNDVCTRAGCLRAFNERSAFFSDYDDKVILSALMTCNGCTRDNPLSPDQDPNVAEKIERLVKEGIETVVHFPKIMHHSAKCRKNPVQFVFI